LQRNSARDITVMILDGMQDHDEAPAFAFPFFGQGIQAFNDLPVFLAALRDKGLNQINQDLGLDRFLEDTLHRQFLRVGFQLKRQLARFLIADHQNHRDIFGRGVLGQGLRHLRAFGRITHDHIQQNYIRRVVFNALKTVLAGVGLDNVIAVDLQDLF